MVYVRFLFILLIFSSCAKVGYLWNQGIGQVSLLTKGKNNSEVLNDVRVEEVHKDKIRKISKFKKHFYDYWGKKPTQIYNRTTFLENDAVTYLVIASPSNKIEARQECFPLLGCFPYLGFFDKEDAKFFARDLEKEGLVTYIRPVYAYSTLGHFDDNILSSFFYYNDFELSELIFHELFHTIFFVNNEVDLNENLANYFGKQMALDYFKLSKEDRSKRIIQHQKREILSQTMVKLTKKLNLLYEEKSGKEKNIYSSILNKFLKNEFFPQIKKTCQELEVQNCYPLKRTWNNASLAAFMTYESDGDKLANLRMKLGLNLKDFFQYIKKKHKEFEDSGTKKDLNQYILN